MDQSMKIQMDIKNNAQDLQNYVLDLNNWEKEMKKKEMQLNNENPVPRSVPPPRNKVKRSTESATKNSSNKAKKISGYDYSGWDKYDVDKACAELDNEEDGDNVTELETASNEGKSQGGGGDGANSTDNTEDEDDEDKTSLIDKAFYEKEKGNQFVKKEEWNNALKCYTNAINLDAKNPVYYANRSLCFLKLKNYKGAEVDATTALQLDSTYVKALQRRAYARSALGQLAEAKSDFEEVLKLEPKNSLMQLEIKKINDKLNKESKISQPVTQKPSFNHKNIFKKAENTNVTNRSAQSKNAQSLPEGPPGKVSKIVPEKKETKVQGESVKKIAKPESPGTNTHKGGGDGCDKLKPETEGVGNFKFSPLPDHCKIVQPVQIPPHKRSKKPLRRIKIVEVTEDEDLTGTATSSSTEKVSESVKSEPVVKPVEVLNRITDDKYASDETYSLDVPRTSVQFRSSWKNIKRKPADAYTYLKKVSEKLPKIFENSLESDLFSDLLKFLAEDHAEKELEVVYSCLYNLSNVKRFSSMTLFMSKEDKACVRKCIDALKGLKAEKNLTELFQLYEL